MLLALRSLFEPSAVVVVHPPAGRVFHGAPPLGRPLFIVNAEATLPSARFRSNAGQITATGTAATLLQSAKGRFAISVPTLSADGKATITGAKARLRNNHEIRHSSVILGANRQLPNGDEEAALLLFLSNQ